MIESFGGTENLANIRNPIGKRREYLLKK